jgi:hypothetical protein
MHGTLDVMDSSGHTTVTWDPADAESVREARSEFDRLIGLGYQAFRLNEIRETGSVVTEEKGERIRELPAEAGRVIMVPQHRGG